MANLSVIIVVAVVFVFAGVESVYISNLDAGCMRCLCVAASGCNTTLRCVNSYCGPMYISRIYWADGNKHVLPEDDPARAGAYEDCANEINCAKTIVENYMVKYGRDCNSDGVTDCDDYALIHYNGGVHCSASLEGKAYYNRYVACRPPKPAVEEEEEFIQDGRSFQ